MFQSIFSVPLKNNFPRAGGAIARFIQITRVNEPGKTFWLKLDLTY